MNDLATMLPGLAALMTKLTGVRVEERDAPQKQQDPLARGKLQYVVTGCMPIGRDEIRYLDNPADAGATLLETVFGLRKLTVQVRFEGSDHRPGQDALFYLERLGTRIRLPSATTTLSDLGLALQSIETFHDISRVQSAEDRRNSVGYKDFIFTGLLIETPATGDDNPVGWIEVVHFFSNTLKNEAGTPNPEQISGDVTRP